MRSSKKPVDPHKKILKMSPEPIRDYVGEALARSANGKAAAFDNDSGGDETISVANRADFKARGFQSKATEAREGAAPHRRDLRRNGNWVRLPRSNCRP